eukprot:TRINITY_DN12202_c0_g1_i1.p2 TRINITY_DN12202_c0_g1~~TRINITY_DN12202_c0_g1_i1.p2  ORF type:complete len:102 (-),score=13.94 TRINITY_DN12202_c0_g1_i1:140-445(-)
MSGKKIIHVIGFNGCRYAAMGAEHANKLANRVSNITADVTLVPRSEYMDTLLPAAKKKLGEAAASHRTSPICYMEDVDSKTLEYIGGGSELGAWVSKKYPA